MIRPFTCFCLLLAAGAGLYTYQTKHQSELLDRKIAGVLKLADAARQRTGVLRAEYALLNDPSRLSDLATTHLPDLRATEPKQFTTLAELDRRLPPVGPPPNAAPPVGEPPQAEPLVVAPPDPQPATVATAGASLVKMASATSLSATAKSAAASVPQVPVGAVLAPAAWPIVKAAPPPRSLLAQTGASPVPARRPPAQKLAAAVRAPRVDSFATPVSAPSEALARVAGSQSFGVGRSGLGGSTFSSLGMARTALSTSPSSQP